MQSKYSIKIMILMGVILASSCTFTKSELIENQQQADKLVFPIIGEVSEVLTTEDYLYVQLTTDAIKIWTATPIFEVKVGDRLVLPNAGLGMPNFPSKVLDKTFGFVYFISGLITEEEYHAGIAAKESSEQAEQENSSVSTDIAPNAKAPNDITHNNIAKNNEHPLTNDEVTTLNKSSLEGNDTISIAELFNQKEQLLGKQVTVQGKVVKYSPSIMGTNWLHLQDGSTSTNNNNDLTITTLAKVEVGNLVMVQGAITLNKDFGAGYKFDVIIENANVILLAEDSTVTKE